MAGPSRCNADRLDHGGRTAHRLGSAGAALAGVFGILAGGCAEVAAPPAKVDTAATVEDSPGDTGKRVVLTDTAVRQLGVQVVAVQVASVSPPRQRVPSSAVLYEAKGTTLVYTNPAPLVYVARPVVVESIEGGSAVLTAGPGAGTAVVSMGAAELFGIEFGVGK